MAAFCTETYPQSLRLRDGTRVELRPLAPTDGEALRDFFRDLGESDLHFMKDDVLDVETTQSWCTAQDRDRSLALVATDGERIVADAVLLRQRGSARHHMAEVRINIAPAFQGKGLGTLILRDLAERAWEADVAVLEFQLVEGAQDQAIDAVRGVGAFHIGTLVDYLRDASGEPCNLAFYRLPLSAWFRF